MRMPDPQQAGTLPATMITVFLVGWSIIRKDCALSAHEEVLVEAG